MCYHLEYNGIIAKHGFPVFIINFYNLYYLSNVMFHFINVLSAYEYPAQHLKEQPGILHPVPSLMV